MGKDWILKSNSEMKNETKVPLDLSLNEFVNDTKITCKILLDDGQIPNNHKLPLLIYPNAFNIFVHDPILMCESLFTANNWQGCWRNGIFSYHHYHSTAHEVLGICSGKAKVKFGGRSGIIRSVAPGDVIIIPAGVGHKNLGASPDLCVIGAYPINQTPDLHKETSTSNLYKYNRSEVIRNIESVSLPSMDPVYGEDGPLLKYWKA